MQASADKVTAPAAPAKPTARWSRPWGYTLTSWLGLVPFLLFCLLFEVLPVVVIIQNSLVDSQSGAFTLNNYQRVISQTGNLHAFQNSILLSLVTALSGGIFGFLAAYGVYNLRANWMRNFLVSFSSIAANFAGVPLAFAFISTLGVTGFVTVLLHAYALAQGNINLVTILISFAVNGNVSIDPGLGNALSGGMIIVLLAAVSLYSVMLHRISTWQGR
jgi:putative spermidine/putrescine transport system permease protein